MWCRCDASCPNDACHWVMWFIVSPRPHFFENSSHGVFIFSPVKVLMCSGLCSTWPWWSCWSPLTAWWRMPPTGSSGLTSASRTVPDSGQWKQILFTFWFMYFYSEITLTFCWCLIKAAQSVTSANTLLVTCLMLKIKKKTVIRKTHKPLSVKLVFSREPCDQWSLKEKLINK